VKIKEDDWGEREKTDRKRIKKKKAKVDVR